MTNQERRDRGILYISDPSVMNEQKRARRRRVRGAYAPDLGGE